MKSPTRCALGCLNAPAAVMGCRIPLPQPRILPPPPPLVQVTAVKLVAPAEASAMLEQIAMSVNSIAAAWWEVRKSKALGGGIKVWRCGVCRDAPHASWLPLVGVPRTCPCAGGRGWAC